MRNYCVYEPLYSHKTNNFGMLMHNIVRIVSQN